MLDLRAGALADPGMRDVGAGGQAGPHRAPLAPARARTPGPRPAVAGMAAGDEVEAAQELPDRDDDRRGAARRTRSRPSTRELDVDAPGSSRRRRSGGGAERRPCCTRACRRRARARRAAARCGTAAVGCAGRTSPTARARSLVGVGRKRTARRARADDRARERRRRRPRPRGRRRPTAGLPHSSPGRITSSPRAP